MFTVVGKVDGLEQQITYTFIKGKGNLSGDKAILFLVQWELDAKTIVGPVGQYIEADIDNPLSVMFTIRKCYDVIESVEGDIPTADKIPEDSIC